MAPAREGTDIADVIRLLTACGVRVSVLPRMLEVIGTSVEFDDLGGRPLLGCPGLRALAVVAGAQARLRPGRGRDACWCWCSPFLLVLVILVKLSSPGR